VFPGPDRSVTPTACGRGLRTTGGLLPRTTTVALLGLAGILLAAPAAAPASVPTAAPAVATAALPSPLRGQDISWPQCPKGMGIPSRRSAGLPMPSSTAKFVVVGLTNGPAFTPNPCLAGQVAWVRSHHVYADPYAVLSYPTAAQLTKYGTAGPYKGTSLSTRLRNVGWAQGQYNLTRMRGAGLTAPVIWMDVEVYPTQPWSSSRTGNKAVVDGALAAYRAGGMKVGVYSTTSQWSSIVGAVKYGMAEWHTTGPASQTTASKACTAASFNGGPTFLAQWWTTSSDYDVMCPHYATANAMKAHFRKF
jgi:hypothetical protein